MRVLCIANQKGGVGKTTTTAGLAGALAAGGERVLMVDLDPHASLSHWFGLVADPAPAGAYELYASALPLAAASHATAETGIALAPAQPALALLERSAGERPGLGRALARALAGADRSLDYVLLDCPPTLGVLMISALAAADQLVVPTQTEPLSLRALDGMRRTAAMVERSRGRPLPLAVVPTLHDRRTRVGQDSLDALRRLPGGLVWNEEIPLDTRLREASRNGATPAAYDPRSRGAAALARLAAWLAGASQPEYRAA